MRFGFGDVWSEILYFFCTLVLNKYIFRRGYFFIIIITTINIENIQLKLC